MNSSSSVSPSSLLTDDLLIFSLALLLLMDITFTTGLTWSICGVIGWGACEVVDSTLHRFNCRADSGTHVFAFYQVV